MSRPTASNVLTAPNVLSASTTLESGTVFTVFRSTPGDTTPRMQMQALESNPVDCGVVDSPERFGDFSTRAEFAAWAERFFEGA